MGPRGHDVAVLFSSRSRDAYAAEAAARGETYTFTDAWGRPRTWLKGEHAYLAPNAASVLLARCNLKHDIVEEADLTDAWLADCRALLIPNAAHLSSRDHRAHRALAARPRSPSHRHGEDQSAAAPARAEIVHADGGDRLHGLALAAGLALRRRRVGDALRQRLSGPCGAKGRSGPGQPRARRPGRAHRRSDRCHHRHREPIWARPSSPPTAPSTSPTRCSS